ncbi:MAG: Rnase Y domain-containing protein, partial [Desulfobulbia bacterium]
MTVQILLAIVLGVCSGVAIGFLVRKKFLEDRTENLEAQGRKLIENALAEAEQIKKEAVLQSKDEAFALKQDAEREIKALKKDVLEEEKKFIQKLEQIERKMDFLDKREMDFLKKEQTFAREEEALSRRQKEIDLVIEEQRVQLEKISGISREEAKKQLTDSIESEARMEAAKMVVKIENEMKMQADKKAKDIIALAISRYAGDYVAEKTVSVVPLPNEEMKGRIIGREGRNIRAIEAATGIDIIIDDTPEAVILSGFNPVRREVARQSLERLITDGRIHPARIEEIVEKVSEELEVTMREAGEQATFDVGAHGVNPELIKLLGRLKYRTSYGQNVLQHSLEVAFLCGVMAAELGIDVKR